MVNKLFRSIFARNDRNMVKEKIKPCLVTSLLGLQMSYNRDTLNRLRQLPPAYGNALTSLGLCH